MSTLSPEQLASLREKFQEDALGRSATAAMLRLVAKGCDPMIIQAYAGRAAAYKSGNCGIFRYKRGPQETARKLRAINRQLKKLAKRAADLRTIWGFWSRMVQADCIRVPEELEEIAGRLSRIQVQGYADWHPQREALLDLLDHVRSSTGRYHYAEISDLINAESTWRAMKRGQPPPDFQHDADSLKMMVQRWRKERRAQIAQLSVPAASSPSYPNSVEASQPAP